MIVPYTIELDIKNVTYALMEPSKESTTDVESVYFDISTFAKFRYPDDEGWERIAIVNTMLNSTSATDYDCIVKEFAASRQLLDDVTAGKLTLDTAIRGIDQLLFSMFETVRLDKYIDAVLKSNPVDPPDLSSAGKRDQDTPAMTWQLDEYQKLYKLMIFCKMLIPLFGHTIRTVQRTDGVSDNIKEKCCLGIFKTIRAEYFNYISTKLFVYVEHVVNKKRFRNVDMLVFQGVTNDTLITYILSTMMVKKFVNIDMHKPEGNIMAYVYSCIDKSISNQYKKYSTSNTYFTHFDSDASAIGGDEDKNSLLEIATSSFKIPDDVRILVEISIMQYVEKYRKQMNIKKSVFNSMVNFYYNSRVAITPINELIVGLIIGDEIGGAIGVRYLDFNLLIRLVVIIQYRMLTETSSNLDGETSFHHLIPLMTLCPSVQTKTETDAESNFILLHANSGMYRRNCDVLFSHLDTLFRWDAQMNKIVTFLTSKYHVFTVAPEILDMIETDNINGTRYKMDRHIVDHIYRYIATLLFTKGSRR